MKQANIFRILKWAVIALLAWVTFGLVSVIFHQDPPKEPETSTITVIPWSAGKPETGAPAWYLPQSPDSGCVRATGTGNTAGLAEAAAEDIGELQLYSVNNGSFTQPHQITIKRDKHQYQTWVIMCHMTEFNAENGKFE